MVPPPLPVLSLCLITTLPCHTIGDADATEETTPKKKKAKKSDEPSSTSSKKKTPSIKKAEEEQGDGSAKKKKPRAMSPYNHFMKEKSAEMKAKGGRYPCIYGIGQILHAF